MEGVDLHLRHLATFVAVAEARHFGRAAQRLHLAQPAVSQQIRRLEDALGVRLLDRDRRTTTLTAAGRAFLPRARRTLAASAEAVAAAGAAARGELGRLRVGMAPSAAADSVLAVLRDVIEASPRLTTEFRELRQRELIDELRHGALDLAVGAVLVLPPRDAGISWQAVAEEEFVVALPGHHRLARPPGPVAAADLDGEPFVSYARDDGPRYDDVVRGLLSAAGAVPSRHAVVRERSTQLALVAAGLGCALVPSGTAVLRLADITYRPLRATGGPVVTTIAAWRTGSTDPVLRRVLDRISADAAPAMPADTVTRAGSPG